MWITNKIGNMEGKREAIVNEQVLRARGEIEHSKAYCKKRGNAGKSKLLRYATLVVAPTASAIHVGMDHSA